MPTETNPFRQSMVQRSQSPEDPFGATTLDPYVSQQSTGSSLHSDRQEEYTLPKVRNNPFKVNLADPPASSSTNTPPTVLEPPSYYESESRRHSDPNLTRPDDEKNRMVARDDSYREGYEEGMRIARERERQRRREYRERRLRESQGQSHSSRPEERRKHSDHSHTRNHENRSHGPRELEGRSNSGVKSSNRVRSKSESAGGSSSRRKGKANESLDIIDKLDASGIYGGGSGFHHDGPFDACTPHRNSKSKRSGPPPIAAFPADGPNNSLAVEDPTLSTFRKDEAVFGRDVIDVPPEATQTSFDPTDRGIKVHGERTYGLGSTTFIDGTPASRDAIALQGREAPTGLGRSRSLLRRQPSANRRPTIDEDIENDAPKTSLLSRVRSLRVGRH